MTKYIWPTEGQTFAEATAHLIAKPKEKKKGRPVGSKNMEGHKAGRPPKNKRQTGTEERHPQKPRPLYQYDVVAGN